MFRIKISTIAQIIFIASLILICAVSCLVYNAVRGDKDYVLTPEQAEDVLGCSMEEFVKYPYVSDPESTTSLRGFYCGTVKINEEGNLVLRLTYEQRQYWKAMLLYRLNLADSNPDLNLSSNYRRLEIYCYREDFEINAESARKAIYACQIRQLLKGRAPEKIKVDVILIDAVTKQTVSEFEANLHTKRIDVVTKDDFSPMNG